LLESSKASILKTKRFRPSNSFEEFLQVNIRKAQKEVLNEDQKEEWDQEAQAKIDHILTKDSLIMQDLVTLNDNFSNF